MSAAVTASSLAKPSATFGGGMQASAGNSGRSAVSSEAIVVPLKSGGETAQPGPGRNYALLISRSFAILCRLSPPRLRLTPG